MALAPAGLVWLGLNLASGSDITCTPGTGEVTFTGNVPTVTSAEAQLYPHPLVWLGLNLQPADAGTIAPSTGTITFTGNVPTASAGAELAPTTGVVTFTGNVPTIATSAIISPVTGVVTFTGYQPGIATSVTFVVTDHDLPQQWHADIGHLARYAYIPLGQAPWNRSSVATYDFMPTTGEVVVVGNVTTVSLDVDSRPNTGELEFTGGIPSVSADASLAPETGVVTFVGNVAGIDTESLVQPVSGEVTFIGNIPVVDAPADVMPETGLLTFFSQTPSVDTQEQVVSPSTGTVIFYGNQVTYTGAVSAEELGRPSGGWKKKARKEWYEKLPTPEEVEEERIRLGILPKKAQKIVKDTVDKATDNVSKEQAALLTAAYLEENKQRALVEKLREKAAKSKSKWSDEMFTVTRALILDELRKKADRDELERILREQEHEEVEANEILEIWMDL